MAEQEQCHYQVFKKTDKRWKWWDDCGHSGFEFSKQKAIAAAQKHMRTVHHSTYNYH